MADANTHGPEGEPHCLRQRRGGFIFWPRSPPLHQPQSPPSRRRASDAKVRLDAAKKVILRLDSSIPGSLVEGSAGKYLSAVDEVILLSGGGVDGDVHLRATKLLEIAMSRLEKEFRVHSANLDADRHSSQSLSHSTPSDSSDLTTEDVGTSMDESSDLSRSRGYIADFLQEIAGRMIAAGYQRKLYWVYLSARQDFLNEFLSVLEADKSSFEQSGQIHHPMVGNWTQKLYFIVRVFLPGERRLCNKIFVASDELREKSFRMTAECFVLQLLCHGNVIATGLQSPTKISAILQAYEVLSDVFPDIQTLFPGDSEEFVSERAGQILGRLGKMARGTFAEVEDKIRSVKVSKQWEGGQIHPLATYVMDYIKILVDYSSSLHVLLADGGVDGGDSSVGDASVTPLRHRIYLLVSDLECKLEEQSKLYEDAGMPYIFLMNNLFYMVRNVEDSELKILLGDDWVHERRRQIRQHATSYLGASWTKVLSCLKDDEMDGSGSSHINVSGVSLKERFKNFNLAFEEIYRTQTKWKVPDSQLGKEMRTSISEKVIPAYRSFVGRFLGQLEYVKYKAEDIEKCLSNLFGGCPSPPGQYRRKLSLYSGGSDQW